jgi:chromosome condensin MukBEF MukE localization factor
MISLDTDTAEFLPVYIRWWGLAFLPFLKNFFSFRPKSRKFGIVLLLREADIVAKRLLPCFLRLFPSRLALECIV